MDDECQQYRNDIQGVNLGSSGSDNFFSSSHRRTRVRLTMLGRILLKSPLSKGELLYPLEITERQVDKTSTITAVRFTGTFHFIPTHEHPTMSICIYTIAPVAEASFAYGLLTSWAPALISPAVIMNGSENTPPRGGRDEGTETKLCKYVERCVF